MKQVISGLGTDLHFLGGHLVAFVDGVAKWAWDDGTPIIVEGGNPGCLTENVWADGEPSYAAGEDASYFLCVQPLTGKWIACSGTDTQRGLVCETKHPEKDCPLSKQDLSLLNMETNPGKRSRYQDHCYYMSPEETSCTEFCLSAGTGYSCDAVGLTKVAE